jgi:ATP-dependent Clp protease ATP-binding subunit ClpX
MHPTALSLSLRMFVRMSEDVTELLKCSFCGKTQKQVKKLIAGPGVWICNECVDLCCEIIEEEEQEAKEEKAAQYIASVPQPTAREIYEGLSKVVIGQVPVLRSVALGVFRHFQKAQLRREGLIAGDKDNVLLIGPTGTGKTLIARTLAELLNVPIVVTDATTLTEAGYVGEDVDTLLRGLLRAANNSREQAELGIVFIDEIDKITRSASGNLGINRDVGGEGVQQSLLTMMGGSGSVIAISPTEKRKNPEGERVEINTTDILFICGGSFERLGAIIRAREGATPKGNTLQRNPESTISSPRVTQIDLERFGFLPEFAGRFTTIAELRNLDAADLEMLLRSSSKSPLREYELIFERLGVGLSISDDAIAAISRAAVSERSGARGLRRVLERTLSDPLFVASDRTSLKECIIGERAVTGEEAPILLDQAGMPISLRRNRIFLSYSRKDEDALLELRTMLTPLMRNKTIDVWFDGEIKASQKWREEVRKAMASTRVAVLMVSPNFLASKFVVEEELPYFLRVAEEEDVKILWLLLSSCLYEETPLGDYQAAHDLATPLDSLSDSSRRKVLVEVSRNIKTLVDQTSI